MSSRSQPITGALFEGRYRIGKLIGEGGFSRVYHAVDPEGRPVALKLLVPDPDGEGSAAYARQLDERFLREARLLEQLRDPHTITMYDFGRSADGVPYMVFEYLEGQSLFAILRDSGALSVDRAVNVLRQTLLGLQAAHCAGILHRDIKPNNIMVMGPLPHGQPHAQPPQERVKLLDFGIAKAYGDQTLIPGNELTATGTLVGTPRYMSPEQLRDTTSGVSLGPASDLYSLGLVAIEMLTGRKLIAMRDRVRLIEAHLSPKPFRIPPGVEVPPGLRAVIHRMVEKDLEARYRSAAEVLRDLADWRTASDPTVGITLTDPPRSSAARPSAAPEAEEDTLLETISEAALHAAMSGGEEAEDPPSIHDTLRSERHDLPDATIVQPRPTPASGPGTAPIIAVPSAPASHRVATPGSSGGLRSLELSGKEKAALLLSLLLPGSGHLLLGQPLKAALLLAGLILTFGVGYLLALGVAFDALLVIRAGRRRRVGPLELLPDIEQVLRL